MNRSQLIALIATTVAAILLLLTLVCAHLSFDASALPNPPRPMNEIVEMDEEFVELLDVAFGPHDPAQAYAPEPADNASQAAQAAGSDLADTGEKAFTAPDVTSERPSEAVRPKKENPPKAGPKKTEDEQAKAREKARKGISDAFKKAEEAQDNTTSAGNRPGDSGSPDGAASDVNGTGSGTVGGGWVMPKYARVPSSQTGRIELRAIVNREGQVTSVEMTGGKAPAGADNALIERCKAEVRSRRFTRNDDNAPEQSIARIVYIFQ